MGYDHGDCFPIDFELNGIPFCSKSKGKLSPPSYPIQCKRKWRYSFLSVSVEINSSPTIIQNNRNIQLNCENNVSLGDWGET